MRVYILLFLMLVSIGCSNRTDKNHENIQRNSSTSLLLSVDEYKKILEGEEIQLVDVRTPEEYNKGSLPGAKNIDYLNPDLWEQSFEKFDKNKPIYIFCQSGNRSGKSIKLLEEMGFKEIYDMEGGYNKW